FAVSAHSRGYTVFHADATALPFEGDQFSYVLCTEVVNQHVDASRLLEELARVCTVGGLVILSTTNRASLLRELWKARAMALRLERMPYGSRSCAAVVGEARRFGLHLREVAWLLSPSRSLAFSKSPRSVLSPLATNFFILFEKRPL
ncbi:MAG: methyltransferase domain-containing protein, partial [Candidatus Tyrphobacter sp.]